MSHNPSVPETLEGWSILHQMFRVNWTTVRGLSDAERARLAGSAAAAFPATSDADAGATSFVQLLGKADVMLIHFRRTFDELGRAQLALARTPLFDLLEPVASYVSIVELGMYDMTAKVHEQLQGRGLKRGSDEYDAAFDAEMETQRSRVHARLFPEIPRRRYVSFYPMNKRRGERKNWYSEPFETRAALMREHGAIGRAYAGQVTQIISGSIGFDDWEWGVDLFADDPLVFKKLIYEMRFDQATAEFGEFGGFYVGLQFDGAELAKLLGGEVPGLA